MTDFDRIAAQYARYRRVDPEVVRLLASRIKPEFSVLDVGCGTGNYSIALREITGCACRGIDPSVEMLAEAKRSSDAITFEQGSAEHLTFPDESFDLVFSVDVVHHMEAPRAYFQEAHRVLRKGGQICTVTESEPMIRKRIHSHYFPETVGAELARYPPIATLRALMAEAGFRDLAEEAVERRLLLTDISGYRQRAFSCLHLIAAEAFERGIECMERDLRAGPIAAVSRCLLLWGTK